MTTAVATKREKHMPKSQDAEMSILGAILLDEQAIDGATEIIREEDFYFESNRKIFSAMCALRTSSSPVDLVTVLEQLRKSGDIDSVRPEYLASLTDGLPRISNVPHYAQIVKEKSMLRRVIQLSMESADRCFQGEGITEVLGALEHGVISIGQDKFHSSMRPMSEVVSGAFKSIEDDAHSKVTGIETGFRDLDSMTGGFHAGEVVIIAARPGVGKTSLAMNIAEYASLKQGKRVGVFSLEMSAEQLGKRMILSDAEVPKQRIRYLTKDDWAKLARAAGDLSGAQIWLDDKANLSIVELMSKCRRLQIEKGVHLIIVDYLQLLTGSKKKIENRNQEISEISRCLKILAKELRIPIIALSQLNRAPETRRDGRPHLADLRESGSIEQDADTVLFIFRETLSKDGDEDKDSVAEIIIAKQRNGPTGTIHLAFLKPFAKFCSIYREG